MPVLRDVDLDLEGGEIHAVVGANGAGKTTLCNIICGITRADAGQMHLEDASYSPASISEAQAAGVRIVMQELNLIDNLSVAENLYFGSLPRRRLMIDVERLHDDAHRALRQFGLESVDPRQALSTLGIGQRQLVEIARELIHPCRILILDEPTAALTDPQAELLFEKIADLKSGGTAVLYVSHRMHEIGRIADRVSILRDGAVVCSARAAELTTGDIVRRMAGDERAAPAEPSRSTEKTIALRIRGLTARPLLCDIDLDIRCGEILGIAGLIGSGRSELLRAIFGADPVDAGRMDSGLPSDALSIRSPRDAVAAGIGLVPEDRKQHGLLLTQSVRSNVTLASLDRYRRPFGWIRAAREREAVDRYCDSLDIKMRSNDQIVSELSGGNQQKVSIARWLMRDCRVVLFDEPTRGIDIHTKAAIYELLRSLAANGKAIVVVSSESRELTDLCDRIVVMSGGRLAAEFERGEWSYEKIMAASFSAYLGDGPARAS